MNSISMLLISVFTVQGAKAAWEHDKALMIAFVAFTLFVVFTEYVLSAARKDK